MAGTAFSPELSCAWSASPSYLWEVPGKPVIVHVALEVMDQLDREVVDSFRSLEARGAEIGGLLLGAVQGSSPFEVFVQSHEAVPSEYKRGPLYKLSPRDLERFEAALEQRVGGGMQIVGFFRSHARKGLGLDTEDVAIFNKFFPKQYQVALLAKPFATKLTAGAIFIREGRSLTSESSYKEFHFRTSTVERRGASVTPLRGSDKACPVLTFKPRAGQPSAIGQATVIPSESPGGVILLPLQVPGSDASAPVAAQSVAGAADALVELEPDAGTGWPPTVVPIEQDAALPGCEAPQKRRSFVLIWIAVSATLMGRVKAVKPICTAASAKLVTVATAVQPMCVAASAKLAAAVRTARPICIATFGKLGTAARATPLIWIAGASAAALVVLSGLLFFSGLQRAKRPATPTSKNPSALSLRVERSADKLLLTWNRDADVIHDATHAVLAIADGELQRSADLDQAQLRDGGIVYLPSNSDINFQLTVTGKKAWQTQSESVRVVRFSPWASPAPPPSPPKPVPERAWSASTLTLRSPQASQGPGAPFAKAPREAPQADYLRQSSESASALDLPDAPGLTSGPQAQAALIPGNMTAPAEALVSLFQLLVTAPPDIPKPRVGGRVSEAQILTQTSPEYPPAARQARVQGAVVVRATIGVNGHVKSAKVLSGPSLLQNPAVAAVRRWVYKPATLNGAAVESETRIDLHFTLY